MTTKCEHCKGTRIEPGEANCTWCDNTGGKNGLSSEVKVDLKPFRLLPYGGKFRYQGTTDVWVRTGHNLVAEWPSRVSAADGTPIQSLCCFCHLDEDGDTLDTLVEVFDHELERDAALAREAVLREEVAEAQRVLSFSGNEADAYSTAALHDELASANSDKEAYAQNAIDLRKRVDALQALLTAADERADALDIEWSRTITDRGLLQLRVDVLEELLRHARHHLYEHSMEYKHPGQPALIADIDAALKPAEGCGDEG